MDVTTGAHAISECLPAESDLSRVPGDWLTAREFAALVGCSVNMASIALSQCAAWRSWNGIDLIVRRVRNPRGGGFQHEVLRSSIPDRRIPVPLAALDASAAWIDVNEFARLFDISREAASKAFRKAQGGVRWRGMLLTVRRVLIGRSGPSVWYVARDSLPPLPFDQEPLPEAFVAEDWLTVGEVSRLLRVRPSLLSGPVVRWAAGKRSRGVQVKARKAPIAKGPERWVIWKADLATVASVGWHLPKVPGRRPAARQGAHRDGMALRDWLLGGVPRGL